MSATLLSSTTEAAAEKRNELVSLRAIEASYHAAAHSGSLDWNRTLKQLAIAGQLPVLLAETVAPGCDPQLLDEFLKTSRTIEQQFISSLIGAYLTPVDCEDLRMLAGHLARFVRLQVRAASSPLAGSTVIWMPFHQTIAEAMRSFAALIPAVRGGQDLTRHSAAITDGRRAAVELLRAEREQTVLQSLPANHLILRLELLVRLHAVLLQIKTAQRDLLTMTLKYC